MTIFGQLAERERRPVEARKKVRSTRTLSTHVRTVWDQSGLQLLTGWFESICALVSHSSSRRGQGIPNPQIWVQVPYEISGYVAKRLCGGLLTRETQVRPLSCPLRSDDVTESILACQA